MLEPILTVAVRWYYSDPDYGYLSANVELNPGIPLITLKRH